MDTATTGESVNHRRPASAVKLLPRLVAPREFSEEETPVLANVRPLLRTRNAGMTAILRSAKRAALVPATILLIGESGRRQADVGASNTRLESEPRPTLHLGRLCKDFRDSGSGGNGRGCDRAADRNRHMRLRGRPRRSAGNDFFGEHRGPCARGAGQAVGLCGCSAAESDFGGN